VCDFSVLGEMVTDRAPPDEIAARLEEAGVTLTIAPATKG